MSWLVPVIHQKIMRVRPSWAYVDKVEATHEKSKKSFNNESAIIGNDIIRGFEEVKWTCAIVQNSVRHDCRHCGIIYFVGLELFGGNRCYGDCFDVQFANCKVL